MSYMLPSSGADPQDFTYFNQSMPGAYARHMYETRICDPLWNTQGCRLSPFTVGQQYVDSPSQLPTPEPSQEPAATPDLIHWWERPLGYWFSAETFASSVSPPEQQDEEQTRQAGGTSPGYLDQVDPCPAGQIHSRNEADWDENGVPPCVDDPNAQSSGLTPAGKVFVTVLIIGVPLLLIGALVLQYKMFTYSPGAYVAGKSIGVLGGVASNWDGEGVH